MCFVTYDVWCCVSCDVICVLLHMMFGAVLVVMCDVVCYIGYLVLC